VGVLGSTQVVLCRSRGRKSSSRFLHQEKARLDIVEGPFTVNKICLLFCGMKAESIDQLDGE
jgi:hypothetical protein